jgi:hypothetical protein
VIRNLRSKHKLDASFSPFTCLATCNAINAAKNSSAVGPDGLMAIHLKHIGPRAIAYLTALFNLSVGRADLPHIWKAAIIVPIQKPSKPANLGPSYQPISLLSPAVKVLERFLPLVTAALPKSNTQHGFAPDHFCTTALLPIATRLQLASTTGRLLDVQLCVRSTSARHLTASITHCCWCKFLPWTFTATSLDGCLLTSGVALPVVRTAPHSPLK